MKKRILAIALILSVMLPGIIMPLNANAKGYSLGNPNEVIPTEYDLRHLGLVTSVKMMVQTDHYTDAAYAVCAAMESNALKMGYGTYDLSEYQLDYFSRKLLNVENDKLTIGQSAHPWVDQMTSIYKTGLFSKKMIDGALTMGIGPVIESTCPSSEFGGQLEDKYATNYNVFDFAGMYSVKRTDEEGIKKLIMKHGGVVCELWYNLDKYFDESTSSLYVPTDYKDTLSVGHMLIVGWDDNYSRNNFAEKPVADGAWIVKTNFGDEFGDMGYIYVSYYDYDFMNSTWSDTCTAYTVSPTTAYDTVYQYDAFASSPTIPTNGIAMKLNVNKDQTMTGVCVYPYSIDSEVYAVINVYRNANSPDDFSSAECIYTHRAKITEVGYRLIEFDKGVNLNKGEKIYVTVKFDKLIPVLCEKTYWNYKPAVNSDETYQMRYNKWIDCKYFKETTGLDTDSNYNICMKVLTRNGHDQEVVHHDKDYFYLGDTVFYLSNNLEATMTLTWKEVEGAEGYRIYRKSEEDEYFGPIKECDAETFKYVDSGLELGKSYTYKVVAFAGDYENYSAEKTLTATIKAPWIRSLTNDKEGCVTIKLSPVEGADMYGIYRLDANTYKWLGSSTTATYVDKKVKKGVSYSYKARAYKDGFMSALSGYKMIKVKK